MSDWYYAADNEQKGPINESELKANFATNKLPTDTLVWKEGMDKRMPANPGNAFSFRPPAPPARSGRDPQPRRQQPRFHHRNRRVRHPRNSRSAPGRSRGCRKEQDFRP